MEEISDHNVSKMWVAEGKNGMRVWKTINDGGMKSHFLQMKSSDAWSVFLCENKISVSRRFFEQSEFSRAGEMTPEAKLLILSLGLSVEVFLPIPVKLFRWT